MGYINLANVQAAGGRLLEQISTLENIRDELKITEQQIKSFVYTEQTVQFLRKSCREIEEEIAGLRKMAECLEEVARLVRKTEQRITETYDLDSVVFPAVKFQTSRIVVGTGCETLFCFQGAAETGRNRNMEGEDGRLY